MPLVLVLCVVGVGDGDGDALPIVGMSPANAGRDRTPVRINVIPSRLIDYLQFLHYTMLSCFDNYPVHWHRARYQFSGIGK
jgi:hypothetical protein